jgi:hypothetical protein
MMADNKNESDGGSDGVSSGTMAQIRNFFKFVNTEYQSDRSSYDRLKATKIPSGVIDTTAQQELEPVEGICQRSASAHVSETD